MDKIKKYEKMYLLSCTCLLFVTGKIMAQSPDGAFKIVAAQYGDKPMTDAEIQKEKIIKIFKDGYWISAFFGDPGKPFNGSGGGTYETKNGKYVETLRFYSWDSTAVGDTYTFDYQLTGNNYLQEGKIDSDKYKDLVIKEKFEKIPSTEPLQNAALEGVWQMQAGDWGADKLGQGVYKDVSVIKIFSYPRFAFAYYNDKTRSFTGAGGGTYQFDGKKLTENIEYWSWGTPKYPLSVFKVALAGDTYSQQGWDNGLMESWKKLIQQ